VYQAKLADLVTALFLEGQFSDREVVIQPTLPWGWGGGGQYYSVVNYVYNVPDVQNAIYNNQSGKYSAPIRKLMLQWMDSRVTAQGANQAYSFAQSMFNRQEDMKKRLKYAARVLEAENHPNTAYMKPQILTQLGQAEKTGGKEYLASVVKCFDDSTLFWNWQNQNPAFDIQVRDFGLAVALQLTDQKPEDYEMSRTPGHGSGKTWNQNAYYFKDDTPNKNPNFGGGRLPGRGGKLPAEPVEEPKKDEKKDDAKKDEPKKLSQEDRRKIAFKKWDEWVKTNVGIDEKDKDAEKVKKWEEWAKKESKADPKKEPPKKDGPKPDEPKKDGPLTEEQKKRLELEELGRKKEAAAVAPAVLPKK
jgi:hypothetical protein